MQQTHQSSLWGIVLAGGEGTRVRDFLKQLCGGRGIKQFCAVVGQRSMLEHTLARVERLIPRERILVVVSKEHREETARQLSHWPTHNVIFQPANRETAPGILLPLAHISHRDPGATVAVFPSDHFIADERKFMSTVAKAVTEVHHFPQELILLGVRPEEAEEGYGWIEPGAAEVDRESWPVRRFWEKPSKSYAQKLLWDGAMWNTFVFVARVPALWTMVREVAPDLCHTFNTIRLMLNSSYAPLFTEHAYETMRSLDFSAGVCQPLISRLRVLAVPEVGWNDWGSAERICESLQRIGKLDECVARFRRRNGEAATPEVLSRFLKRPQLQTGFSPMRTQIMHKEAGVSSNSPAIYLKD